MKIRLTDDGSVQSCKTYSINNRSLSLNVEIDLKIKNKTRPWKTSKPTVTNIIITNMLYCLHKKCRLYYSRHKAAASKTIYNTRGISNYHVMNAIDELEQLGYLVNHIASRQFNMEDEYTMSSWIEPTPFFKSEFLTDTELLMKANNAFNAAWMPIIMRDEDKTPVDYRADEYSFAIEAVVSRLNDVNGKFVFTDHEGLEFQNLYCRIFNNSNFLEGGRFYKASVLNIENKESNNRLNIKIDGESVVEVDYTALHIFISAEKLGIAHTLGEDPYKRIADIDRNIVKLTINTMFNCTSRGQAVKAMIKRFKELKYTAHTAAEVVTAVFNAFPELKDEFCYQQCSGLSLQNKDSWMTHYVANVMSTLGKPFLPVHDSGIVRAQDEVLLIELMCNAYKHTLGVDSIVHMRRSKMVDGVVVKEDVSC